MKRRTAAEIFIMILCQIFALSGCSASGEEAPAVIHDSITSEVSSGYLISDNRVIVNTPKIDIDISRDSVPVPDFEKPMISVPSVNTVSPDIHITTPGGQTFAELFESMENEGISITLDGSAKTDMSPAVSEAAADTNLTISISSDRLKDMKISQKQDTPLTLYYRMSSYSYRGVPLHGACTPMTMINCLNSFNDNGGCTLTETLDLTSSLGIWSAEDGMSAEGIFISVAALNDLHGTANCAALFGPKDCDELGDIIDRGLTAGVCVDSSMLWKGTGDGYADHMIAVLDTDRDTDGTLKGFEIIDSGMGLTYISADLYDECALGSKLGFAMIFGNPENPPY